MTRTGNDLKKIMEFQMMRYEIIQNEIMTKYHKNCQEAGEQSNFEDHL